MDLLAILILWNVICATHSDYAESTSTLHRLIHVTCRDTSPVIVYDGSFDDTVSLVTSEMGSSYPVLLYEYRLFYSFLGQHMKMILEESSTLMQYHRYLTFILICGEKCIEDVMSHVTVMDNTIGLRSLLRHLSTWLIISPDPAQPTNTTLDNVVLITDSTLRSHETTLQGCFGLDVRTLLWMPSGREWSGVSDCNVSLDQLYDAMYPNKKRGLNGRELVVSTVEWRPYAIRTERKGNITYIGAGIDAMEVLGKEFNFSYDVVEPGDMRWGQQLENGTATGVLGMLQRAEADMCPVPYGISLGRSKVMDISSPTVESEYTFLYRKGTNDKTSWFLLLSCFSWQVYICLVASLLWIVLFISLMIHSSPSGIVFNCFDIGISVSLRQGYFMLLLSIFYVCWLIFNGSRYWKFYHAHVLKKKSVHGTILTSMTITVLPESRILAGTWCLFCLVMTSVYTGNLVALATVDRYNPPFNTLQELAQQNEYIVGAMEGGYAENVLMTSTNPVLKTIYKKVTESKNNMSSDLATYNIERLLTGNYVLITSRPMKEYIRSLSCDVLEMRERLNPVHSGYAFPRYSPLMKLFDKNILLLKELGVFAKLKKEWTEKPKICHPTVHGSKLKLHNLQSIVVTCAVGIVVAAIVLLFEIKSKS